MKDFTEEEAKKICQSICSKFNGYFKLVETPFQTSIQGKVIYDKGKSIHPWPSKSYSHKTHHVILVQSFQKKYRHKHLLKHLFQAFLSTKYSKEESIEEAGNSEKWFLDFLVKCWIPGVKSASELQLKLDLEGF